MKQQLRAVLQTPGSSTESRVSNLVGLFRGMAMLAGCRACLDLHYGSMTILWIDSGGQFLDLIASGDFPARGPKDSHNREFQKVFSLCQNMRLLAQQWRECIAEDGSLLFSIRDGGDKRKR